MLRALKQLWALETPNQKELKPPGARERKKEREREKEREEEEEEEEVICSPKEKQRCPLPPASPEPDTKVWAGRKKKTDGSPAALCPQLGAREEGPSLPTHPGCL